jgi:hypothetical protein
MRLAVFSHFVNGLGVFFSYVAISALRGRADLGAAKFRNGWMLSFEDSRRPDANATTIKLVATMSPSATKFELKGRVAQKN